MPSSFRTHLTVFFVALVTALATFGCKSEPPKPGQKEFETANSAIGSYSNEVGFGNDAAATALAKKYADTIKKLEAENFEGGKDAEKDVVTKGNFLTYCHSQGSDIVFLVQVPNLDTYEADVRKELFKIAWEAAQTVTNKAAGKNLVIALRGKLLYGAIGKGKANGPIPAGEIGTSLEVGQLYAHFAAGGAAADKPADKPAAAPAAEPAAK
jgi:hypothetical protein